MVCGLREIIEIFWPINLFSRVDFPALGGPAMVINPKRWLVSVKGDVQKGKIDNYSPDVGVVNASNAFPAAPCSAFLRLVPLARNGLLAWSILQLTSNFKLCGLPD